VVFASVRNIGLSLLFHGEERRVSNHSAATEPLFNAEFASAARTDRHSSRFVLDAEDGFVLPNLWTEDITVPHSADKVRNGFIRLNFLKILLLDNMRRVFGDENKPLSPLIWRYVVPGERGFISGDKRFQFSLYGSRGANSKLIGHHFNIDRRSLADIFTFDPDSQFHIAIWPDNNSARLGFWKHTAVGHNPRSLFGTKLLLGICESLFGGFGISIGNCHLPHIQDDASLILPEGVLHNSSLSPVDVNLNASHDENAKRDEYRYFLGDVSLRMLSDIQPYTAATERVPEADDERWFYITVLILVLIAVLFAVHILRSGVI
jgi:hypothetical protein